MILIHALSSYLNFFKAKKKFHVKAECLLLKHNQMGDIVFLEKKNPCLTGEKDSIKKKVRRC